MNKTPTELGKFIGVEEMKLQVSGFLDNSLVNGEGLRSVLFVSGCPHNCRGCHNQEMQNYSYGESVDISKILDRIKNNIPIITGVTFSGGEPFEQAHALCEIAQSIKALGLNLWCYTGYTLEQIKNSDDIYKQKLLEYIDVLVDGPFIEELKENAPKFAGSSNQRVIKLN